MKDIKFEFGQLLNQLHSSPGPIYVHTFILF